MFTCTKCNHTDKFDLFTSPEYKGEGKIDFSFDKNKSLKIYADDYTFSPDLSFMNKHAICSYCGSICSWKYSE